jgi:hypothetical protein
VTYFPLEDAPPDDSEPELLMGEEPAGFLVPAGLLEDYGDAGWLTDYLGKALRGEIEPRPPREPRRHRCLACWLVSLLPGHDRCGHGYIEGGCETCGEW